MPERQAQGDAAGRHRAASNRAASNTGHTRPASSSAALGSSGGGVSSWRISSASPACAASCSGLHHSSRKEGMQSGQRQAWRWQAAAAAAAGGGAAWRAAVTRVTFQVRAHRDASGAGPGTAARRREHRLSGQRDQLRAAMAASRCWCAGEADLMLLKRPGHSQACRPLFNVAVAVGVRHAVNCCTAKADPNAQTTAARALRPAVRALPLCECESLLALLEPSTALQIAIAVVADGPGALTAGSACGTRLRALLQPGEGPVTSKVGPAGQRRWVVRPGRPGCALPSAASAACKPPAFAPGRCASSLLLQQSNPLACLCRQTTPHIKGSFLGLSGGRGARQDGRCWARRPHPH